MSVMTFEQILGWIFGTLGTLASAIFYLRYVATKANIEGKNETIDTLSRSNNAFQEENERVTKENNELKGQVTALQQIVTNTPEIIKLTRSVAKLTESVARQHKDTSAQNKGITALLSELVGIMKDRSSNDNDQPKPSRAK